MSETTLALPFTSSLMGSVQLTRSTKPAVSIPADLRADFERIPGFLATQPNTLRLNLDSPEIATPADAEKLRAQLAAFADEMGWTLNMPKHAPAHWSRKDADAVTGMYLADKKTGKMAKAKWVEDNGVNPTWNVGCNVNFRLTRPKVTTPAAPVKVLTK